ncbi:hypothetical protein EUTSA_v10000788mg [Eutrema salsugineum]|uniref:Disease resistance RPP13-like protein 4 n=1 Tax=Eutrema salsugineum TaxID=72664 RepID=V4KP61_EUTSA|nr:uncharacterized protein LOC18015964 [Eutrema salsugineum]XP_006398223.1 uncharacterized protein LOC18015964 [Eutrema salsugineum]ESQ39675.1 hypothetical protein EUTSA_v10000788mg [Eutrema salsugineum]ESQ39676.1 hypothetical protein EUTSA_v10000788mg [Eutrema salsugineum]
MVSEEQTQTQADNKPVDPYPEEKIHSFLEIVNSLQETVSKSLGEGGTLRKHRSAGPELAQAHAPEKALNKLLSLQYPKKNTEELHISKLQRNLRLLREDVVKLQDLRSEVAEEVKKYITPLKELLNKVAKEEKKSPKPPLTKGMKKDLEVINKKIFNLMCQVPLLPNKRKKTGGLDSEDVEINSGKGIVCLQGIHADKDYLKGDAVYRYVQGEFEKLDVKKKIYLLSFAVFPENQEVNRTMLMYWWIGEGLLDYKVQPGEEKPEDVVKKILKEFTDRNLIEPVENKGKVEPNSYKMSPFVHSSVVLISQEIGLFKMYEKGEKPAMTKSGLYKVCLVEESSSQKEAKAKKMPAVGIETVFNVSERFPDFTFKWFSEDKSSGTKKINPLSKTTYKMLKVFYLGRWERTAKRHIEVENPELMKYLKHMTKLKLLSFQGISRIERLDDAVCKLHELIILDLRACYNLEKLPDKIDSLKALIYLDITDCYMIDRMPKRLSWLDDLEVLKGFVVSDAEEETVCTLKELSHLKKLRKLTITINKGGFTVDDLFMAIINFESLEKLKVAWGGINKRPENKEKVIAGGKKQEKKDEGEDGGNKQEGKDEVTAPADTKKQQGMLERAVTRIFGDKKDSGKPGIPTTLKKLDLQCFPDPDLPTWLRPNQLQNLEKLYIKGGTELTGFGELPAGPSCRVKVLRLKFLPKLKVEWRDLSKKYFPNLEFLEKYQCPNVSFCPCDGIGIWRKP